jgi:hypothetical protein
MIFPDNFPDHAQSAVIAAKVRAAQWMQDELNERRPAPGYTKTQQLASVSRRYVLRIFAAFTNEACELGIQRVWRTRQIDLAALEFLRLLLIEVRSEYSHLGVPDMLHMGNIRPEVLHEFRSSSEWKAYDSALLVVADLQAKDDLERIHARRSLPPMFDSKPLPKNEAQTQPKGQFLKRSEWTRTRLRERGWDHNDPQRFSGPDRKTMLKILSGIAVKEDTIEKLVMSLNRKKIDGVIVTLLEVPTD